MDTTQVPTPVEPGTEAAELWKESYQGEVLGEAYFTRMQELATDAEEKRKLEYLVRLERSTKDMLVPYLERLGLPTEPDAEILRAMGSLDSYEWAVMLEGVRPVAAQFLTKYRRLAELVDENYRAATDALVAHELALDDFCRRELSGDSEHAPDSITALPHYR